MNLILTAALALLAAAVIGIRRACRTVDAALWEHTTRTDDVDVDDVLDLIAEAEGITRRAAAGENWER